MTDNTYDAIVILFRLCAFVYKNRGLNSYALKCIKTVFSVVKYNVLPIEDAVFTLMICSLSCQ